MTKTKVQYTKELVLEVDDHTWDICEKVYQLAHSLESIEIEITWYANVYRGGVGKEEAKKIIRKNSLFYLSAVNNALKFISKELETSKLSKSKNKSLNPNFVYRLCEFHARKLAKENPEGVWGQFINKMKEKYSDKERINKRIGDRAQNLATTMRLVITAIEFFNELPVSAYKGKEK